MFSELQTSEAYFVCTCYAESIGWEVGLETGRDQIGVFLLISYMGQQDQEGKNIHSMFFWKGKAGSGWEMKISQFCQWVPSENGLGV